MHICALRGASVGPWRPPGAASPTAGAARRPVPAVGGGRRARGRQRAGHPPRLGGAGQGVARRLSGRTRTSAPEACTAASPTAVYGGLGLGLRAASAGLDRVAATGAGPRLESDARGRFVSSAVNGLIGDRLAARATPAGDPDGGPGARTRRPAGRGRPRGRRSPTPAGGWWCSCTGSARTSPTGTAAARCRGTTYAEALAADGWTPVFLRANTGLGAARERRGPRRPDAAAGGGVAGRRRPGRAGRALDGRADRPRGRRRGQRGGVARGPTW